MLQQALPQDILAHPSTWLLQDPPGTGEAPRSSVDAAIARAAGRTKSLFSAHWVHIETPVDIPHVAVEASQLDDALAAMLERACQHALVGSRIDIEAWCDPSWVFIAVMAGAAEDSADRDTDGRPPIRPTGEQGPRPGDGCIDTHLVDGTHLSLRAFPAATR